MNNDDRYHLSLGRFIDAFSTAEHNLKFALAAVANVPRETAKAIFSGVRVKGAIDYIRRIFESRNETIPPDINRALSHMSAILTARDEMVHYGNTFDGTTLTMTMTTAPHTISRQAKTKRRSLGDIDDMTADLLTLGSIFISVIIRDNPNTYPEALELFRQAEQVPFRYKPQ